jgi:hypothetical protein
MRKSLVLQRSFNKLLLYCFIGIGCSHPGGVQQLPHPSSAAGSRVVESEGADVPDSKTLFSELVAKYPVVQSPDFSSFGTASVLRQKDAIHQVFDRRVFELVVFEESKVGFVLSRDLKKGMEPVVVGPIPVDDSRMTILKSLLSDEE